MRRSTWLLLPLAFAVTLPLLAFCDRDKPYYLSNPMAPAGSTPEQIRAFCTRLGDEAADWNYVSADPTGPSYRARDATFAACMARHNLRP
jgi:hypothetical protein